MCKKRDKKENKGEGKKGLTSWKKVHWINKIIKIMLAAFVSCTLFSFKWTLNICKIIQYNILYGYKQINKIFWPYSFMCFWILFLSSFIIIKVVVNTIIIHIYNIYVIYVIIIYIIIIIFF